MKKWIVFLCLAVFLSGCTAPDFETVTDLPEDFTPVQPRQVIVELPEAALAGFQPSDTQCQRIYEDFSVVLEVVSGGNLCATLTQFTGCTPENLVVLSTRQAEYQRYDTVFTSAGEGCDMIGRLCVLDDGLYHYVLCIQTTASEYLSQTEQIEAVFASFSVAPL